MDLTPDGPLGERDKDMNTLPAENVSTTHHGSTGSDQAGKPAEGLQETKEAFGAQFSEWGVEDRKAKSGTSTGNLADQQTKPLETRPSADSSNRHTRAHHIRTGVSGLRMNSHTDRT